MRSHHRLAVWGWFLVLTLGCCANLATTARAAGPPKDWKVADVFQIEVEVYPRDRDSDKPIDSYVMHAALLPVLPHEECGCWKLQFASFSKQPQFKDSYRLWIDKTNGQTRKGSRFTGPKETPLPSAGIAAIVLDAPPGYPIEVIPDGTSTPMATPRTGTTVEWTSRPLDDGSERKAILRVNGKADVEIRQLWPAGSKWWSEYERFHRGRRELHARSLAPKPPPPPPAGVTPAPSPAPVAPSPSAAGDDFRADPRLQVRITANFQHRPLHDVLEHLSRETNVPLQMEASLAETAPQVGSSSLLHVPAWKVMDGIVHDFVVEGRWNKTGDGYELSASRAVEAGRSPEAESRRSWLMGWLIVPPLLLGLLLFYRHRRSSRAAAGTEESKPNSP